MLIDIANMAGAWPDKEHTSEVIHRAATAAVRVAGLPVHEQSELSVALSSDDEVRALNRTYRSQDKPTNVLSFAQSDELHPDAEGVFRVETVAGPGLIGDIVLAYETLVQESDAVDIPFDDHLSHLVIHGLLHLFGYDHGDVKDAETMETLEVRILAELDIPDPYQGAEHKETVAAIETGDTLNHG